ncbi:hypothetical protein PPYR_04953 [Photinus pyralis]|uniref:LRRCT domain-containing protein n=1 Tax=Photinus pyralis TaxID=7054 RepID=A0A5N4AUT0_PHOPY|nr:toll-like receptor 4 [Photinus pyralis]XP_031336196.1 toll-like receptor 4 [Photinus pyralis]XP_031336197.1 toll-like receptor 4 [Photinus pyralis]KAB0801125.1 hypothetical protein PPYR_05479 [Photinus pyralis]KAB0802767.1 hypothetical protein PPYR_04953 [Photinus pyralis]
MKELLAIQFLICLALAFNGNYPENCFPVLHFSRTQFYFNDVACEHISVVNGTTLNIRLKNNHLTKTISFTNSFIPILPADYFRFFPFLERLFLLGNNIETVERDAFNHLNHLQHLSLYNNSIKEIFGLTFRKLSNVKILSFSKNRLEELHRDSLYGLVSVQHLNLSHNSFRKLNSNTFDNVPSLKLLDISHNILHSITSEINLKRAADRFESYDQVPNNVFKSLPKLEKLNLSFNNLSDIPIGCFGGLNVLSELRLSNNVLTDVDFGTFSGLGNIATLYLDNNKLISLPEESFYVLKNLHFLYIHNNLIDNLDVKVLLKQTPNLTHISLGVNEWNCDNLFNILRLLTHFHVHFANGTSYDVENVNGIACTSRENLEQIRASGNFEDPYSTFVYKFAQFFDRDFKNTPFYNFLQEILSIPSAVINSLKNLTKYIKERRELVDELNRLIGKKENVSFSDEYYDHEDYENEE